MGTFFAVYAHHDILDIFGTAVSPAGAIEPMVQVTVTASVSGPDHAPLASATDRDEWLTTNNIWWNKATAQRMTHVGSGGVSFSKQLPTAGASGLGSTVTSSWEAVAGCCPS